MPIVELKMKTKDETGAVSTANALKMAYSELLEVLDSCNNDKVHFDGDHFHEVLKACKEALEVTEQENNAQNDAKSTDNLPNGKEPLSKTAERDYNFMRDLAIGTEELLNKVMTPLSDDEVTAILVKHGLDNVEMAGKCIDVVLLMRDVEKAHGIGVKDEA